MNIRLDYKAPNQTCRPFATTSAITPTVSSPTLKFTAHTRRKLS